MKAIILAAGRGTRLRSAHEPPKCLLELDGATLLDRYVRGLDALGIEMVVVAGYRAGDVRAHLDRLAPRTPATVVLNEQYEQGSVVSLARGLEVISGELLLLDGDVLFHPALLERIATGTAPNGLLVDLGSVFTGEEYMAGVDASRVTSLRRAAVKGHETSGEWVGFARLGATAVTRLNVAVDRLVKAGETAGGYEDALASILADEDVRVVATAGLPWTEIDFPDDIARAAALAASISDSLATSTAASTGTSTVASTGASTGVRPIARPVARRTAT